MPDEPRHEPVHEQEDSVRRLLAEARHDQPLPPDVAARLDTLLGELVETRSARTQVHSLGRSRRQRAGLFLAAAAAAVVVAAVAPRLAPDRGADGAADSGASSATSSDGSGSAGSTDQDQESAPSSGLAAQAAPEAAAGDVVLLGSATFDDDVRRLVGSTGAKDSAASSSPGLSGLGACGPAAYGPGRLRPAVYDGVLAVLALRPPVDGTRVADLLECGTATVLRSTTVSVP